MRSLAGIPAKNVVNESKYAKIAENRISEIPERIVKEGIAKERIAKESIEKENIEKPPLQENLPRGLCYLRKDFR
ncbi:MAG: hypothetical protein ACLRO4_09690 [Lachnospiraceae bacterium]